MNRKRRRVIKFVFVFVFVFVTQAGRYPFVPRYRGWK